MTPTPYEKKRDEAAKQTSAFCYCAGFTCSGCEKNTQKIFCKGYDSGYQSAIDELKAVNKDSLTNDLSKLVAKFLENIRAEK